MNRRRFLATALTSGAATASPATFGQFLLWAPISPCSIAQETASATTPSFDAVSIRPINVTTESPDPSTVLVHSNTFDCRYSPDRVRCQLTIGNLILEAFQIKHTQLSGPEWLFDLRDAFAFEATMPPGTTKEAARKMMQQALVERFALKFHRELRQTPVYALIAGKNGAKLQPADDQAHRKLMNAGEHAPRPASLLYVQGHFAAVAAPLDTLAFYIQHYGALPENRPVVNETGLTGEYRFDLRWLPAEDDNAHKTLQDPAFTQAVEKQLGLAIEKRTLPYDFLVIDHIEREPSAN